MKKISEILSDSSLTDYIKSNIADEWHGTVLQGYPWLGSKQKGVFGELFSDQFLLERNFIVSHSTNSDHDRVVNGIKTEIKFSAALTETNKKTGIKRRIKDKFMMNHIGIEKDWDRLIFIGINPNVDESRIVFFEKEDIKKIINNKDYFRKQAGGDAAENDDYMSSAGSLKKLIFSNFAKSLEEW